MVRKHTEDEVLKSLQSKNDVRINPMNGEILILTDKVYDPSKDCYVDNKEKKHDLGNGSWGKLDYLTKYCGYVIIKVDSFHK